MSCVLCGEKEACFIKKEGAWDVVQCKNCSFVYVTPLPDEQFLHKHYQTYLPASDIFIDQWRAMMVDVFNRSLALIEKEYGSSKGSLLDVGCGYGFFLELALKKGWKVDGVEPCAHARAYAASRSLKIESGDLFARAYDDETFDVITLFYVLEHLRDPLKYLGEINRILKSGGLLLARVPNTTPLVKLLKVFNIPNKLYDVPSHLSDFSPRTIALALKKTGFDKIQTFPGGATRPYPIGSRIISQCSSFFADILYVISGNQLLLPGVSKTTIARKMNQ